MGERIGGYFASLHTSHGVTLRAGERVDAVTARTVKLGGGEVLEADVVVLAVGATPNGEPPRMETGPAQRWARSLERKRRTDHLVGGPHVNR